MADHLLAGVIAVTHLNTISIARNLRIGGVSGDFRAKNCRHFELADFREQGIASGARYKFIGVIQVLLNRTDKTFIESIGFVWLSRHGANS